MEESVKLVKYIYVVSVALNLAFKLLKALLNRIIVRQV
jgi:hypothetical protein